MGARQDQLFHMRLVVEFTDANTDEPFTTTIHEDTSGFNYGALVEARRLVINSLNEGLYPLGVKLAESFDQYQGAEKA